jgi:hypothetical protein
MNTDNTELHDELREEYDLSQLHLRKSGPARKPLLVGSGLEVHLEPDVAELFPSAQAVNEALRFLIRLRQQQVVLQR